MSDRPEKDDGYWKNQLTPEEYRVCREKGTERPFTGEYWDCKTAGTYVCRCCGTPLFDAAAKYDSGSGWPSFWQPIDRDNVVENRDMTLGMVRTELTCRNCGSHLGHVFEDGPQPTGLRYCINSLSLRLNDTAAAGSAD